MTEENVEIVRANVEALSKGDFGPLLAVADPAVEFESYLAGVEGGGTIYHRHEGLNRYAQDLSEAWEYFHVDIQEYRDLGNVVAALGDLRAKGRASGVKVARPLGWIVTFSQGKATRVQVFVDQAEALEAAGLSE